MYCGGGVQGTGQESAAALSCLAATTSCRRHAHRLALDLVPGGEAGPLVLRKRCLMDNRELVKDSLKDVNPRPLFSRRSQMARDCIDWCLKNKVRPTPLNMITASAALGFFGREESDG